MEHFFRRTGQPLPIIRPLICLIIFVFSLPDLLSLFVELFSCTSFYDQVHNYVYVVLKHKYVFILGAQLSYIPMYFSWYKHLALHIKCQFLFKDYIVVLGN